MRFIVRLWLSSTSNFFSNFFSSREIHEFHLQPKTEFSMLIRVKWPTKKFKSFTNGMITFFVDSSLSFFYYFFMLITDADVWLVMRTIMFPYDLILLFYPSINLFFRLVLILFHDLINFISRKAFKIIPVFIFFCCKINRSRIHRWVS